MIRRLLLLLIFIFGFFYNSYSQVSFSHSLGLGVYINTSTAGFAAVYSPRFNFINFSDKATISIGTHLGVGYSGSINSRDPSSSSNSLVIDAPLALELNVGHACNTNSSHDYGFYIGGGLGINKMSYVDVDGNISSYTAGIVLTAGIRTGIINGRSLGLHFSYLADASGLTSGVFGFGIDYTFGMEDY